MKTFGKVCLTLLYILCAGCDIYLCKRYLAMAEEIWN